MKKIYLVDVSSLFFRAFYAIRPLSSSKGVPVNAVYGFISMIVKLFKEKNPDHILFCYDRKEPSFRKDIYSDYKANRTEMPDDLQVQMPYLKQVAELFGIADLEVPGFEADDLIGTVAKKAESEGYQVYIVSGDKDFSQLVSENIFIYDTMKEYIYTREGVKEKHGVYPEQFIDFLAITGDTSDHIPGVAGVGPKGAQKLIEQFGTLENIYQNIDHVSPAGLKSKLETSKENAFLSKKLVTIVTDVNLSQQLDDYKVKNFKTEELRSFLQDLNFKSFEKTLLGDGQQSLLASAAPSQNSIKNVTIADSVLDQNMNSTIHQSTNQSSGQTVDKIYIQISMQDWNNDLIQKRIKSESFFSFVYESQIVFIFNKTDAYVGDISQARFDYQNITWSGYDIKKVWTEIGLDYENASLHKIDWDLMLGAYCLKSQDTSDLLDLIKKYLDVDLTPEKKEKIDFLKLIEKVVELNQFILSEIKTKQMDTIYNKLEKPVVSILYGMERRGVRLNIQELAAFSKELEEEIANLEIKITDIAGEKFNIASPKQLGAILFEKMGLEAIKKTKTGYSTDNEVLEKMDHPIAKLLIDYRELTKLKSTYVDALPELVDQKEKLHTHFNQALTATGRLSSTNPNLQNIPIKTEKGQRVRQAFIASEGLKLLSLDYSQIELRILAHISNDTGLIQAFSQDHDIHAATAAEVFAVNIAQVTKEQRRIAKAVNFGIAYGQGAYGLAETLGISRTESKDIIDRYFKKFSGIKEYIDSTIEKAHTQKYVETLFGRRRYLSELDSSNAMVKKFGERAAINAPIQGTASDLVKMAMIDVDRYLRMTKSQVIMLLQVHDELIFEGPIEELEIISAEIQAIMENVVRLRVPLKVNKSIGDNWDQAH